MYDLPNNALVNYIFPNNEEGWWALMIVIYPYLTGLIAGAFVVSALYHVLNLEKFKPVANFALIAAFSFGLFAAVPLLRSELPNPYGGVRIWHVASQQRQPP